MIEDPIVNEIRKYRQAHSEKYNYDLDEIVDALNKQQKLSNKKVVSLKPRLIADKSA